MTASTALPTNPARLVNFPVPFFATVMGLSGLTIATHKVETLWGLHGAATVLFAVTLAVFCLIAVLYGAKAVLHPEAVRAEWNHPVRISFFPASSIGLILLGIAGSSVNADLARVLWGAGTALHLVLTLLVMRSWIDHSRYEVVHSNPAWFIPVVGNVLVPIVGMRFAPADVSWFFFSIGLVFWVVLLTIVIYRLIFHPPLPGKMVPTLFILLAPPSVAFISWVVLTGGVDPFARILYFAAVFFFLLLLTQLPKFAQVPFAMSWWAYSFPLAAFTIATLVMGERVQNPVYTMAGQGLYVLLVLLVGGLVARTLLAVVRHEICIPEH
ncbi:SLAC1 anion channel family protein [Magnetospirillum aberrantis]|uniref:C4-dicarboxylate ABC transporter n=1 Tax=Magnetospirillum aberrantis SpK TaxID=908842 RepID=A0A7C9UYG1_9PROT|nr:SLAC1 anion channel family protein [Magnetospirillum aberrantis]NFV81989.1 C4-dicarboxylate ABC transporter [Magnetospirillum aberrantis SpK]